MRQVSGGELAPEERAAGPWRTALVTDVAATVLRVGRERGAGRTYRRHRLVPLPVRLGRLAGRRRPGASPGRAAGGVRPPAWDERQRPGAIEVPAGCTLLIVEGVGSARRESMALIDVAIWVQAGEAESERRGLARVGEPGGSVTDLIVCGTPGIAVDPGTEVLVAPPP